MSFRSFILLTLLSIVIENAAQSQNTISGFVFDKDHGHPVADASISSPDKKIVTKTNKSGWFVFTSATPVDSIIISAINYKQQKIPASDNIRVFLQFYNTELAEVIVSANREQQPRSEAPVAIHTISKSTINDTKATRLDMLLNKVPGVFMVDLGNEQHAMSIRQPMGYSNMYLYLQDGVPIRTVGDFNHNALIEINQAAIERVEVIKGPASSLYGSEAVGGAVNFITATPSRIPTAKVQVEAGSRGYKRTDFFVSNTFKKLGLYIGGYFADRNEDDSKHNDFRKLGLTFRADYHFSEKSLLNFTADYIDYKTDQVGGLDSAKFYSKNYESFYRFTYRKVNAFRLKAAFEHNWSESDKTTVTLFHRNTAIGQNPFYSIGAIAGSTTKAKGQINEDAFTSYGVIAQHRKKFNFLNARWITGISVDYSPATYWANYIDVDVNADKVYYAYTTTDSVLTNYRVSLFNSAVYTQLEFNPVEKFKILVAGRYDRMDYDFRNFLPPGSYSGAENASNYFSYFTPKVGFTYGFTNTKGVYANYSVGFAPPNITDLFTGVQVPTLKPSTYNNYEIGGWTSFDEGRGNADIALYKMDGKNEIMSVRQTDGTYKNQNVGKTTHYGIEANARYELLKGLQLRVSGTIAHHEYKQYVKNDKNLSGHHMSQAPSYFVNSELSYKPGFLKGFRVSVEWQGMGGYHTDAENTAKYNGFNILNARTGYQFKSYEVWVNCLNVGNVVYATTVEKSAWGTTYRPGQLRTFNVGLAWKLNQGN
ncbi:TonB-dependent receptor [Terrimonas sp.]|uniref:TonB-dependent receptor n=1 Tax=Terrimonas sp. TaxID=1914338 RepID=UPI000D50FA87|nr:TonB-dependent receptor [Terrimonas sp.]PVD52824.1 TonB-dependent receptor [Terrimonas sp.]